MKTAKVVRHVLPGSIAEAAGIEEGDGLLAINNERIKDVFDYRFLIADETLILKVEKKNGEIWEIEVEKDEYEDLGLEFDCGLMDEVRRCKNKCIFCFIDQLPPGMRETLYLKDDDLRLSFLHGNYVTLTNVGYEDLQRIIKYRMSPVNVSVHTTNPDLRVFMMKNKRAGDIMDKIKMLINGGIKVNCQVVLCRGINDGKELDATIKDLALSYPGINSISVVPVGITRHRQKLYCLEPYDKHASESVIRQVEEWQHRLLDEVGSRVVFLADEFYIMAERDLPGYDEYEDFPQIENGVGMITLFKHEFYEHMKELDRRFCPAPAARKVSIATGVLAYKHMSEMARRLEHEIHGLKINVYKIRNEFFGENVTVAGLLTGRDIVLGLSGNDLGQELLISRNMLKADEHVFLDDYSVEAVEEKLSVKVTPVENNGKVFIEKVLGI